MPRFRLLKLAYGFPEGTVLADSYFNARKGDWICPALTAKPNPEVLVRLADESFCCEGEPKQEEER